MSTPSLEVLDLRVDYGSLVAVRDVTFALHPGDACALIGPNGAGKSSVMKSIAGLLRPTRGSVRLCGGALADDDRTYKRRLGYMAESFPVYPTLTVRQFMEHFARAYQIDPSSPRIDECMRRTEIHFKADEECGKLSRGMMQRLVLARTLLPEPEVLVLDEPASGLDPVSRTALRDILLELKRSGRTLLVSSHILTELAEFCDKVCILERGVLRRFGRIEELASGAARRTLRVRWRASGRSALDLLRADSRVTVLVTAVSAADFDFAGSEEEGDDLLARLISSGVRVSEWKPAQEALERVLIESHARSVQ